MKDKDFYNRESSVYSSKRYPDIASNNVQFFFKKRLDIVMNELKRLYADKEGLRLLEVGCADGIVLRKIDAIMGDQFSEMIGIDTAEDMIRVARPLSSNSKMEFFVRGNEPVGMKADIIIEIGVANYTDFANEFRYAKEHIQENGVYILSLAGNSSLNARVNETNGYANFLSYGGYESAIREHFNINKIIPVGLHVPLLWRVPALGRAIQPLYEGALKSFAPNLYHEKVYILSLK